jgi:polyisoprenoid-binding protein YceI
MMRALWITVLAAVLPAGGSYRVDGAGSSIQYTIVHKLHQVEGKSSDIEGRAVVKDDGMVQAMVRVPVPSFRSGDGNRDEHMLEAVEGGKFPFVIFKGVANLGPERVLPATPLQMQGEVELHGVKRPVVVPLSLAVEPDGSIRARGSFDVSLDAHGIERPSLLFVKVEDNCRIDFELILREIR